MIASSHIVQYHPNAFEYNEALTLSAIPDELQLGYPWPLPDKYITFIPGVPTRRPKTNPRSSLVCNASGNKGDVCSVDSIENGKDSHMAAMVDPRGNVSYQLGEGVRRGKGPMCFRVAQAMPKSRSIGILVDAWGVEY